MGGDQAEASSSDEEEEEEVESIDANPGCGQRMDVPSEVDSGSVGKRARTEGEDSDSSGEDPLQIAFSGASGEEAASSPAVFRRQRKCMAKEEEEEDDDL